MRVVIEKRSRRLTVLDGERELFHCRAALGREPEGPKRREGDGRTPEGVYTICLVKERGKYGRSLGLSYPGVEDAQAALLRLRDRLLSMEAECLVPVPIHPARMRKRGFNQAELLARKLGDGLGLPVRTDLLFRCRNTEPQKELGPQGRLKNLEKAFTAAPAADGPVPERVILVDDIYTTGSTIEACSRALGRAGVKKTYFFALCIGQGR